MPPENSDPRPERPRPPPTPDDGPYPGDDFDVEAYLRRANYVMWGSFAFVVVGLVGFAMWVSR